MQKINFQDLPSTTTPINASNLNLVQTNIENFINLIVDALGLDQDTYDNTKTYAVGDLVIHNYQIWECTTAISTAENWNSAHWTLVPVFC